MIYLVSVANHESGWRLRRSLEGALDGTLDQLSYDDLFFSQAGPIGHYIFADLDQLTRYELDTVAAFARALTAAEPRARILNAPARVLPDRTSLLLALHDCGINAFTVARLQFGERPRRYPVFIRAADGHEGPETELIESETAFDETIAAWQARGVPLRGRIAVEFAAQRSPDGLYRKYGVFNIGGTLIPQHVMLSEHWTVKNRRSVRSAEAATEELDFVRTNPHADVIGRVFAIGSLDFGRVDYGVVDGQPQIYEINSNPHFPRFEKTDARSERRAFIRERLIAAFREIDQPLARGRVAFDMPTPRTGSLRLPVTPYGVRLLPRMGRYLWRRAAEHVTRRWTGPERR